MAAALPTRYLKISVKTKQDYDQLMWVLKNITFFPNATTNPALPVSNTPGFDYRQLFRYFGLDKSTGMPIIKVREVISAFDFSTNYVPEQEWVDIYKLSEIPTITEISEDLEYRDGKSLKTDIDAFLVYHQA